ncbi:unnamed protein product [Durusdinium trenchii]
MLSNSDKWVVEELDRRRAKQKSIDDNQKDKTADSARWPEQHSTLAEKYGVQWPLQPSAELAASEWFNILPPREKEVLCFVEIMSQQITSSEEKIQFVDISQSASRLPTSTKGSKVTPTILPGSKLWHVERGRLLLGIEMMSLQGLPAGQFKCNILETLSQKQCADMAGDMFATPCIMAVVISILTAIRFETESEAEEIQHVSRSMQQWCKS